MASLILMMIWIWYWCRRRATSGLVLSSIINSSTIPKGCWQCAMRIGGSLGMNLSRARVGQSAPPGSWRGGELDAGSLRKVETSGERSWKIKTYFSSGWGRLACPTRSCTTWETSTPLLWTSGLCQSVDCSWSTIPRQKNCALRSFCVDKSGATKGWDAESGLDKVDK